MPTLNYYENNSSILSMRYELADVSEIQKLLLQTFEEKSNVLEVGCGSGRDASFMVNNNYNITAIDGSKNMIEEAKKIHSELSEKLFYIILPNDLEFDIKFDGIYSIATLMHLSKNDLEKTISKIYNLLNQNGKFLMAISLCRDDINENGFDEFNRFFLLLEEREWIVVCEKVGFKVINKVIINDGLNRKKIKWLTLVLKK